MRPALLLLALLAACATAEPEPMPERPLVACGPSYCSVDRGFFNAMAADMDATRTDLMEARTALAECMENKGQGPVPTLVRR